MSNLTLEINNNSMARQKNSPTIGRGNQKRQGIKLKMKKIEKDSRRLAWKCLRYMQLKGKGTKRWVGD